MVGRGLRPKQNDGDCVILDLAGNSLRHGLPEEDREWSLLPRGEQTPGEPRLVRCPECDSLSPAASHQCQYCGAPFGERCGRCGIWRVWERWSLKATCGEDHDMVCDLCHLDAHLQARLPVTEELRALAELGGDSSAEMGMNRLEYEEPHAEPKLGQDPFLRNLIEEERHRVGGVGEVRKEELSSFIGVRGAELADDAEMGKLFENYLDTLPTAERPQTFPQKSRRYTEWEGNLRRELAEWRDELAGLEDQPLDKQLVYNNARDRLLKMFEVEAIEAGLLPREQIREKFAQPRVEGHSAPDSFDSEEEMTFVQLVTWFQEEKRDGTSIKPWRLQGPSGEEASVNKWTDLLLETAEWLIRERLLTKDTSAFKVGRMSKRFLIHQMPNHPNGGQFKSSKRLSNGLYVELTFRNAKNMVKRCVELVDKFGRDPAQFRVWVRQ